MRYYLDTEFNGFGGGLLSLALVSSDARDEIYLSFPFGDEQVDPWVLENVLPVLRLEDAYPERVTFAEGAARIAEFFRDTSGGVPYVIADWPDDIRYLCELIVTGPGEMAAIPRIQFDVLRVDAYPTTLPGAIQHNALWDARALRDKAEPRMVDL